MNTTSSLKIIIAAMPALFVIACSKYESIPDDAYNEWLSGGQQTVFVQGAGSFNSAFPVMTSAQDRIHETGDIAFEATFVSTNTPNHSGLGPIFNNVSCVSCHIGDGRGKAPETGEPLSSMLIRLSVPGKDAFGGPLGVPGFGGQFQTRSIFGIAKEGDVIIDYEYIEGQFPDGESFQLRKPIISLAHTYLPMPSNVLVSPRIASPVFGLGLLEAISDADLLKLSDEFDQNNDGVSGKVNWVWNVKTNQLEIGRFGWKAGQPTVIQQSAGAYVEDMGITNSIFGKESAFGQIQAPPSYENPELSDSLLHAVAFYVRTLAVPARRSVNESNVIKGKMLFNEIGCANCHHAMHKTIVNVAFKEISNQVIFPYTDLLLHDMGEGLADYRPEFLANEYEWRTSPLWGIGLTDIVNGHTNFLHDGRARNLTEAILWHGGEAESAKNYFLELPSEKRKYLLQFLNSL